MQKQNKYSATYQNYVFQYHIKNKLHDKITLGFAISNYLAEWILNLVVLHQMQLSFLNTCI
jgi:hypothetical protein